MRTWKVLFGVAAACFSVAATAATADPARQLAAELLIIEGDARRLWQGKSGPLERRGLRQRLEGALASLPVALRRAGTEPHAVKALRTALRDNDAPRFARSLQPLIQRHRFTARFMMHAGPAQDIAAGAKLHRETCAVCHDTDRGDVALPAHRLQRLAASLSREEFAARLWLGVRGTREIAYANPFSDAELAALFAYYRSPP